jgi:UDP-N-acetylglucosamine 2-epimerase (non-hydrolysing)
MSCEICAVVGARPNFVKMAPVVRALTERRRRPLLVHTGQHYDAAMSQVFFEELALPRPDVDLGVGSGSHAQQTAEVLRRFEEVCAERRPRLVVVAGDVNSTLAAALVAAKLGIAVAHVEAGLRSFDRSMPEEINRVLTDHLAELLFTTEESANRNLEAEGIAAERVHFAGNCMVDSLLLHREGALATRPWQRFDVEAGQYAVLTLHRPSNVDDEVSMRRLFGELSGAADLLPILFPAHPRTRSRLAACGITLSPRLRLLEPLPYLDFIGLMARARLVLTDSGGIQEETTVLEVPCLTLRRNTERPVTLELGTNRLIGERRIDEAVAEILRSGRHAARRPPRWDGAAGERVAAVIEGWLVDS